MRHWSKLSRINLAIALCSLVLIAIRWTVTLQVVDFERTSTIRETFRQNSNLALAYEEHAARTIGAVDQLLVFIEDQYRERGPRLSIRRTMERATLDKELLAYIDLVDERGELTMGSLPFEPFNMADRDYFTAHQDSNSNGLFIGKPVWGRVAGKWVIPISRRLSRADGSFAGVVYASVDPGYFMRSYREADLGRLGLVTLVGLDGVTRARQAGEKSTLGEDLRGGYLLTLQAEKPVGNFRSSGLVDGVPRYFSYRTLPHYPLIVMVGSSEAEALVPFYTRERNYYTASGIVTALVLLLAIGLMVAMSRRNRMVDSLATSEARFRSLTQLSSDWYWEQDEAFRFSDVVGKSIVRPQDLLGKAPWELPNNVLTETEKEHLREMLESHQPFRDAIYKQIDAVGNVHFVSVSGEPVFREDGSFAGYRGTAKDITERKRTEERLRDLSHAVEQSPAATVITDTEARFVYVNSKFVEITGYTAGEVIGRTPAMIKSGLTSREVYENLWHTLLSGGVWRGEMQNRRKNGDLYWEYAIISPMKNERGEIVHFIAVMEDVTERKRTRAALDQELARRQATEQELFNARITLAEADRLEAVGRLAAGVAHEVKNPLAIMRLGVDYLLKQTTGETGGSAVLRDMHDAVDRADGVIRGLLDFSRHKAIEPRPSRLEQVLDNALQLVRHEMTLRNIAVSCQYGADTPAVLADPDQLMQVFINLLTNAAQAIGRDGRIEVILRAVHLDERDLERDETGTFKTGDAAVIVDVRDDGPGVSAEHEKLLFQPFFTTKPVGEGTGLGLAVSRNIVIMHGGSISVRNRPEGGASALVMFRAHEEQSADEKTHIGGG